MGDAKRIHTGETNRETVKKRSTFPYRTAVCCGLVGGNIIVVFFNRGIDLDNVIEFIFNNNILYELSFFFCRISLFCSTSRDTVVM